MRCFILFSFFSIVTSFMLAQDRLPENFTELERIEDDLGKNAIQSILTFHQIRNRGGVFDQPVRILYHVWNETDLTWHKSRQDLFTYDPDQQLIYALAQNWNGSSWIDQYRANYVYTPDDQLRLFQFEFWDGLNWHLYVRFTYDYDVEGHLISFLTEDWIEDMWVNRYRRLYAHDHELHRTIITRQEWWQEAWHNRQQEIRQYDQVYHCQEELFMEWDEHEWTPAKRHTFTYTPQFLVDTSFQQEIDGTTWKDVSMISYTYDTSGHCTTETHTYLEPDAGQQNVSWTFQYDARENMAERHFWRADDSLWTLRTRDVYTYDIHDRNTTVLTQDYAEQFINQAFVEYTYADIPNTGQLNISSKLIIHPVPAQTTLHISFTENFNGKGHISIYTLDGKKMISQTFDSLLDQTVPIHFLANGIYVLKFIGQDGVGVKTFVKI